ncbi:MAG: winged helix-turn-helix transcriptional regulator [Nitrososphaerota archaeon]|nr:winged helix-turn-helix transcriptional regulator [Nitrososphaerota archaeon]
MPLRLDETDTSILKALMKDGRLSFRQIATQVGVTTPTVESRVKKMTESGVIKKIAPILDIDKVEKGVAALLMLKVELAKVDSVTEKLTPLDEVRSIFLSTGAANLIVRVATSSNESFQRFLNELVAPLGVDVVSSEVITRTVKDEQGVALYGEMAVALVCDYCGGEVSGKPFTLNVGEGKRFFCCKTCLSSYKAKYSTSKNATSGTNWNG